MRWHVAVQVGDGDHRVDFSKGDGILPVPIDSTGAPASLSHNAWELLGRNRLPHPPPAVVDLFRMAAAVFSADVRIPRKQRGSDDWTRHFVLHLPVSNPDVWARAGTAVEALLRFLTGDVWKIEFDEAPFVVPPMPAWRNTQEPIDATAVCLLSGGLDSFIGASDALANGARLYMVSVGSQGSAAHSTPAQESVAAALHARYGGDVSRQLPFRVSPPPKRGSAQEEDTQRSRSLLFLGAGVLTAAAVGPGVPLIVPENGFITLNVPLTSSRLGTLSTRTTHPETIRLFKEVLHLVGIDTRLLLPYRFVTKGQMLDDAADRDWVIASAAETVSCAHPLADRFTGGPVRRLHCGHCLPCIIRRAALHRVGADNAEDYRRDLITEDLDPKTNRGTDVRAVQMAVLKYPASVSTAHLLRSGPLPAEPQEIQGYDQVYREGLREIGVFLQQD